MYGKEPRHNEPPVITNTLFQSRGPSLYRVPLYSNSPFSESQCYTRISEHMVFQASLGLLYSSAASLHFFCLKAAAIDKRFLVERMIFLHLQNNFNASLIVGVFFSDKVCSFFVRHSHLAYEEI